MFKRPASIVKPHHALPLSECLAKSITLADGTCINGVDVATHCRIVGFVAKEIMARMPVWLKDELFPDGSELIAAAHDIGKVSPTFQEKIHRALDYYFPNSLKGLENAHPEIEKQWGGHAGASQAAIYGTSKFIPEILGRHHGSLPSSPPISSDEIIGGTVWQSQRMELVENLKKDLFQTFPEVKNNLHSDVLAGLTTVADWIGSGSMFDRLLPDGCKNQTWENQVHPAIDQAGFIRPQLREGLTFEDIFSFTPRSSQLKLINSVQRPGVYILEAPMGIGKTEAALYAAYKAMEMDLATGFYFALPTQMTSNKIHDRVTSFLGKILDEQCLHRKALLLHGSAWLQETEMGESGQPGRSWFDSAKRGLLAPFAVGTIDQALLSVMNVRHGFVRTFGLAGKVVILDEVHTYDSYTGTLMDRLVQALQEIHCTVIILSATLTRNRRNVLLGSKDEKSQSTAYPLISALPRKGVLSEIIGDPIPDLKIFFKMHQDQAAAITESLLRAERGEQVLWIENTVAEAQAIYKIFAATEMNLEVGLLHSRFIKADREINESKWVRIYGKEGKTDRYQKGRILVGTQVLEQSLDIDADFLITRICPTDMLLQRLGRLWRHRENDSIRTVGTKCEAWILSPELLSAIDHPKTNLGKSAMVYSPYVLCRTIEVWQNLKEVVLPSQIRCLLESTYSDRQETGRMATYFRTLVDERETLCRLALVGLSSAGKPMSDRNPSTRHSDQLSCEVLLLKSYRPAPEENGVWIKLLNEADHFLPKNPRVLNKKEWRITAALIAMNTVSVPEYMAPKQINRKAIECLAGYVYLGGKDYDSPFRIQKYYNFIPCPLADGVINHREFLRHLKALRITQPRSPSKRRARETATGSPARAWRIGKPSSRNARERQDLRRAAACGALHPTVGNARRAAACGAPASTAENYVGPPLAARRYPRRACRMVGCGKRL